MAIHHLLYACVECGRQGGIKPRDKEEVCDRCGTRYSRVDGALIRCEPPNGKPEVRHPSEWLDLLEANWPIEQRRTERQDRVISRIAERSRPHYHGGVYLGQIEVFGPPVAGLLTLSGAALTFVADEGTSSTWPLAQLTAVQPSSTSLQLKVRKGAILSFKFPDASPLLWEERIRAALQAIYRAAGKGEIAEYQPRIICR